jgi:hypothetical protein
MPDHEVTLGEVYRAIVEVRQEQRDMRRDLVGRAEYEADQEGIDRRFEESGRVHVVLEAKVAAVDAKVDSKVTTLEQKIDAAEKDQRANRSKWALAWVGIVASPLLGIVFNIILRVSAP